MSIPTDPGVNAPGNGLRGFLISPAVLLFALVLVVACIVAAQRIISAQGPQPQTAGQIDAAQYCQGYYARQAVCATQTISTCGSDLIAKQDGC